MSKINKKKGTSYPYKDKFIYQADPLAPCTQEEKKIYGVNFKRSPLGLRVFYCLEEIKLIDLMDDTYIYKVRHIAGEGNFEAWKGDNYFKNKEEADKWIRNEIEKTYNKNQWT